MASRTMIPNPTGSPPEYTTCVTPAVSHPAALKTPSICVAKAFPSPSPIAHSSPIRPLGSPVNNPIRIACCCCVSRLGRAACLRSANAFSAIADFSRCLASSISTFCWAALASVASLWRPATFPVSAFRSLRKLRLSCSKFLERSSALAAVLLASSIRASASRRTASCTLLPESHTSQVNSAVSTRIPMYAANIHPCRLEASAMPESA